MKQSLAVVSVPSQIMVSHTAPPSHVVMLVIQHSVSSLSLSKSVISLTLNWLAYLLLLSPVVLTFTVELQGKRVLVFYVMRGNDAITKVFDQC